MHLKFHKQIIIIRIIKKRLLKEILTISKEFGTVAIQSISNRKIDWLN